MSCWPTWFCATGSFRRRAAGRSVAEMLEHLRALPGVRSASTSNVTPISGWLRAANLQIDGYTSKGKDDTLVYLNQVSDRFFETLGTDLVAGRDFNAHDTLESPKVAIVNQTLAKKFFAGQNPIGRRLGPQGGNKPRAPGNHRRGQGCKIRHATRGQSPHRLHRRQPRAAPDESITFELSRAAGSPASLITAVKSSIAGVNRDASLHFTTLALQVDESLARERLLATLSGFFGGLALLLAMIGLYGVMSYNVTRRRNEIGIRMALGAEPGRVLRMVMGEAALLIGIGLAAGLAVALATTRSWQASSTA